MNPKPNLGVSAKCNSAKQGFPLRTLIEAIAYIRFYNIKLEGGAKKYFKDV